MFIIKLTPFNNQTNLFNNRVSPGQDVHPAPGGPPQGVEKSLLEMGPQVTLSTLGYIQYIAEM